MIAIPAARDIARTGASFPLVGDLTATDLVASEEAYLGPRVRALMIRLAERDGSTEEHTRRVAILAAQVGEELKLPATARRHLAVGGLLHDIGKLSVPLEILRKPAGLTDEEFAEIKRHPEAGRRLLDELGGFSPVVRDLVSDHHERLDGRGYPRGLTEEELPLHTRILTVCDVYDALVSDRVYRAAWTPERAFELLRDDTGSAFDERCVEALARVVGLAGARARVGRRRGARAAPRPRAPGLAAAAAAELRPLAAEHGDRVDGRVAAPVELARRRARDEVDGPAAVLLLAGGEPVEIGLDDGGVEQRAGRASGLRARGRAGAASRPPRRRGPARGRSAGTNAPSALEQPGRLGAARRGRRRGTGCRRRARSRRASLELGDRRERVAGRAREPGMVGDRGVALGGRARRGRRRRW